MTRNSSRRLGMGWKVAFFGGAIFGSQHFWVVDPRVNWQEMKVKKVASDGQTTHQQSGGCTSWGIGSWQLHYFQGFEKTSKTVVFSPDFEPRFGRIPWIFKHQEDIPGLDDSRESAPRTRRRTITLAMAILIQMMEDPGCLGKMAKVLHSTHLSKFLEELMSSPLKHSNKSAPENGPFAPKRKV